MNRYLKNSLAELLTLILLCGLTVSIRLVRGAWLEYRGNLLRMHGRLCLIV